MIAVKLVVLGRMNISVCVCVSCRAKCRDLVVKQSAGSSEGICTRLSYARVLVDILSSPVQYATCPSSMDLWTRRGFYLTTNKSHSWEQYLLNNGSPSIECVLCTLFFFFVIHVLRELIVLKSGLLWHAMGFHDALNNYISV